MKLFFCFLVITITCDCFGQQHSTKIDNRTIFFIDSQRVEQKEINKYNPNQIAAISVIKGDAATALIGPDGKNGVVFIETKAFAKTKYLRYFKSKSKEYAAIVHTNDSSVQYILNGRILKSNFEGDLSSINDRNFKRLNVIDKSALQNRYNVMNKEYGVVIESDTSKNSTSYYHNSVNNKPPAALPDSSINAVAHWKKGEVKNYYINHTKESTGNGKPSTTIIRYYVSVKVIDSTVDGYTLQWSYVPPPPNDNSADAKDMYQVYKGVKIIFKTSPKGMFTDLVNWQELRDFYFKLVDASMPKNGNPDSDSTMQKVKQMFSSKPMVINAMAKEIVLLYQVYGKTYTTKGSTVNTEFPNPFVPVQTIPALLSMKVSELSQNQNYYKVVVTQNMDSNATSQLFESVIDKMGIKGKDSAIAEVKKMLSNFEINDFSEYKINSFSGWPSRMEYRRTVTSNILSQKDDYLIEEKK